MLIVLDIQEAPKRSFFKKIKYFFKYPEISKEYIGEHGFQHIRIKAEKGRKGVNWQKIINEVDKDDIIVTRKDTVLPAELKKHQAKGIYYKNLLKIRAVLDVLTYANIPPSKLTVAVCDENGYLINTVKELLKHSSTVKIITKNKKVYNQLANDVMEEYGASILITENEAAINTADVVISLSPLQPQTMIPLYADLCSTSSDGCCCEVGIRNVKVNIPYRFKYCIIDGLDETDFCAGLFEAGMKQSVSKLSVEKFCYYNQMVNIRDGAEEFKQLVTRKNIS